MSGADQPGWYSSTHSLWGAGAGRGAARRRSMPSWITISAPSACDAVRLADVSEAEPALDVQAGELGVRRTATLSNRGATVNAEAGETEVHETGAAAQQFADLGTAAMLIAVEPADLIVVDVAAGRDRFGATGAHRRRPASCAPSGVQLRTGPPEPGSSGGHRRTPPQASPCPVCQPLEASPPALHPGASAAGAGRLNHRDTAVVPGQTWCQSEREAVRNPSALRTSPTTRGFRRNGSRV